MAETFKLPTSSFEELVKLIKAYASEKEGVSLSLDDVSKATGVPRTVISGNNGFLVQIGLITEGNKKAATEIGRSLGRAYTSKIQYEIERLWKELISETDFLNKMVSAVRIRNGMDRGSFLNHIVYSSGLKDTKQNRTGAGAIIDIMKDVGILNETDGKLTVSDDMISSESDSPVSTQGKEKEDVKSATAISTVVPASITSGHSIVININIDCNVNEIDVLSDKIKELLKNIN